MGPEANVPCEALLFVLAELVEDYHIERLIEAGYAIGGAYGKYVSVLAPLTLYIDELSGADSLGFVRSTLPELGNWHNMEWSGWSAEQLAACMAISSAVNFPDPALETVIRSAIGKPTGDIYAGDLEELASLRGNYRGISNLDGIQHCIDLEVLVMSGNEIADISPLAGLGNLTELNLADNEIVDIAPLASLTNLGMLFLHNNDIVDISPLSGLSSLTGLFLRGNRINDITPLVNSADIPDGAVIDIRENHLLLQSSSLDMQGIEALEDRGFIVLFDPQNLTPPSGIVVSFGDHGLEAAIRRKIGKSSDDILDTDLIGLWYLEVSFQSIASLEGIEHCVDLMVLGLPFNEIADVSPLANLSNLMTLSLEGNVICDISPLSGLTDLGYLELGGNEILDISPLSNLTNLTLLSLYGNKIVDVSPLSGLIDLAYLNLGINGIASIEALSTLADLTSLLLFANQIVDIGALSGLAELTELYLQENGIVDISALSGLTKLTELHLNENEIVDISALSGLTKLTTLDLANNEIDDIAPLVANAAIGEGTTIDLRHNLLNLSPGTADWVDIETLQSRGVNVSYVSQDLVPPSAVAVSFPDPGLEAAIRREIDKPTGDIYDTDLIWIIDLYGSGRDIADIEGIQQCIGLTTLSLRDARIADISPLAGLTNLTALSLYDNLIVNIGPLAGLSNLTHLSLYSNQILDISPLSGLTNLTYVHLANNRIVDIRSLSSLFNLTQIVLSRNEISDISILAGLSKLVELTLHTNRIEDCSPVSNLTDLTHLHLGHNQIADISALSNLTNLTELYLRDNKIADITPLIGNPGIDSGDYVDLRDNLLDLTPGSPDMLNIEVLQARGVEVRFDPQN